MIQFYEVARYILGGSNLQQLAHGLKIFKPNKFCPLRNMTSLQSYVIKRFRNQISFAISITGNFLFYAKYKNLILHVNLEKQCKFHLKSITNSHYNIFVMIKLLLLTP